MDDGIIWKPIADVASLYSSPGGADADPCPLLVASCETVADVLPTATKSSLKKGLSFVRAAMSAIRVEHEIDDHSPAFVMGRLASLADILGYAVAATADDAVLDALESPDVKAIMAALARRPLRALDLLASNGGSLQSLHATLERMQAVGISANHRRGSEVFHNLTAVGQLLAVEGR